MVVCSLFSSLLVWGDLVRMNSLRNFLFCLMRWRRWEGNGCVGGLVDFWGMVSSLALMSRWPRRVVCWSKF